MITLDSWSSVIVVNFCSAGVLYALGVYGLVLVNVDLMFSILCRKWLANSFANSSLSFTG